MDSITNTIYELKVYYGYEQLTEGTDYDVTYRDNINAGTATVIVTFKGDYTGTLEKNFTIIKATPVVTTTPTNGTVNYQATNKRNAG